MLPRRSWPTAIAPAALAGEVLGRAYRSRTAVFATARMRTPEVRSCEDMLRSLQGGAVEEKRTPVMVANMPGSTE